jgi:hypothetical protein
MALNILYDIDAGMMKIVLFLHLLPKKPDILRSCPFHHAYIYPQHILFSKHITKLNFHSLQLERLIVIGMGCALMELQLCINVATDRNFEPAQVTTNVVELLFLGRIELERE